MDDAVARRLLDLNRRFYEQFAQPFVETRATPQPGFDRLLDSLSRPLASLLDVGCGDGRFGRYLLARQAVERYAGVDFSPALLAAAQESTAGEFYQRDVSEQGCLSGLGDFAAVACLAVLQHIPGHHRRLTLVQEMAAHLQPGGLLILSTWQFLDNVRQQRKIISWQEVGLRTEDVDPNDYLLTWRRGGLGYRYVCLVDVAATARLAQEAGLVVVDQFRSDGREGDLNLYTVLRQSGPV